MKKLLIFQVYLGEIFLKTIKVVAAIIIKDKKVFACERAKGDLAGGWEFPGGKIEESETPEEALIREIKEELDADISVDSFLMNVQYDYPSFHLDMDCYICSLISKEFVLLEHSNYKWLSKSELDSVNWLEADIDIVKRLEKLL